MNVKKLMEKDHMAKLLVKSTSNAFLNAIRRTAMADVPVLAIENLTIYQNDSPLFDEHLASRLGLLPIKTDLKTYRKGESVKLLLEEKGPKTVYSGDIHSTDPKIELASKKIPVTQLNEGQELKLEMEAVMETGNQHVKWQPALVSYNEVPEIKNEKKLKNPKKFLERFPAGLLEDKAGKIVFVDPHHADVPAQQILAESEGALEVGFSKNAFVLTVEPFGQLTAEETLHQAAEVLKGKLEAIEENLKKKLK